MDNDWKLVGITEWDGTLATVEYRLRNPEYVEIRYHDGDVHVVLAEYFYDVLSQGYAQLVH